jgi:hypothetical protein
MERQEIKLVSSLQNAWALSTFIEHKEEMVSLWMVCGREVGAGGEADFFCKPRRG